MYIDLNTQKRVEIKSAFEKDFYKLMNKSVFGKTMENVRMRKDIQLCNVKRAVKYEKSPRTNKFTMFDEDFLACHIDKPTLNLMNAFK